MRHPFLDGVLTSVPSTVPNELGPSYYVDMLKSVNEMFQKIRNPEVPDIILLTRTNFELLREQFGRENPHVDQSKLDRIVGVPFEVCEDELEMDKRALELAESGKRCLVCK